MQEALKKYNQDQIDLLDLQEYTIARDGVNIQEPGVDIDGDIRAGLGGDPALKDVEVKIHNYPIEQPQDIWKGEVSRGIIGDEIENMADEPAEKRALGIKESTLQRLQKLNTPKEA